MLFSQRKHTDTGTCRQRGSENVLTSRRPIDAKPPKIQAVTKRLAKERTRSIVERVRVRDGECEVEAKEMIETCKWRGKTKGGGIGG